MKGRFSPLLPVYLCSSAFHCGMTVLLAEREGPTPTPPPQAHVLKACSLPAELF